MNPAASQRVTLSPSTLNHVRRLELRVRKHVEALAPGAYRSAFKGRGIEFSDLREYTPGDDVRSIDWNVTARAQTPFVKLFIEERELTVTLAVDVSASTLFGSTIRTKAAAITELAAAIATISHDANDRTGLVLFADHVVKSIASGKGRAHYMQILHELVHAPQLNTPTDVRALAQQLGRTHRKRSLMFIISDFLVPENTEHRQLTQALGPLARKHELVAIRITDPAESSLPKMGLLQLVDPETGQRTLIDSSNKRVREAFRTRSTQRARKIERAIMQAGANYASISTDDNLGLQLANLLHRIQANAPLSAGAAQ
ncbi:MAG: DUF58 domain-containing protein [Phycisphaeraceae bacterium]|nr:DUF58 domain-containing protein [Phycisphaerales bacterium]MCB9860458.1 DUF58 domain-containing protein [Phycisphaeraceae bacterium]